jgi:hypothetical protein
MTDRPSIPGGVGQKYTTGVGELPGCGLSDGGRVCMGDGTSKRSEELQGVTRCAGPPSRPWMVDKA